MWKQILLSFLSLAVFVLTCPIQVTANETHQETHQDKSQETDKPHFDTWQTIKRLDIIRIN